MAERSRERQSLNVLSMLMCCVFLARLGSLTRGGRLGGTRFLCSFFYWMTLTLEYVREKGCLSAKCHENQSSRFGSHPDINQGSSRGGGRGGFVHSIVIACHRFGVP